MQIAHAWEGYHSKMKMNSNRKISILSGVSFIVGMFAGILSVAPVVMLPII
jgi:hypothetical protein